MSKQHIAHFVIGTFLALSSLVANAQTQIFEAYNFNKCGYYLLGKQGESDYHSLTDSLNQFYINDAAFLNKVKEEWTFAKESPIYACGYHYNLYLCKSGKILERISINLNCNVIATSKGYFYFEADKLRAFYGKTTKARRIKQDFARVEEGRAFINRILKSDLLIMVDIPEWYSHDGMIEFRYECDNINVSEEELLEKLRKEITKKYKGEDFELEARGGSSTEIVVHMRCNKSMGKVFDSYKLVSSFTPFTASRLDTWWVKQK